MVYHGDLWRANTCYRPLSAGRDVAAGSSTAPWPGCPVCVTPVETIDYALKLATQPNVILASFGDMMRVPGSKEDLLSVKARGADIRMLYTPLDALSLAEENPDKEIVFFAIGFETTAPVHLMALKEPYAEDFELFHIDFLIHGSTRYRGDLIRSGK